MQNSKSNKIPTLNTAYHISRLEYLRSYISILKQLPKNSKNTVIKGSLQTLASSLYFIGRFNAVLLKKYHEMQIRGGRAEIHC